MTITVYHGTDAPRDPDGFPAERGFDGYELTLMRSWAQSDPQTQERAIVLLGFNPRAQRVMQRAMEITRERIRKEGSC